MTSPRTSCDAAAGNGRTIIAIKDLKGESKPITLLVRQGDYFRTATIAWNGGLRYPHLEKIDPKASSTLDALYTTRK